MRGCAGGAILTASPDRSGQAEFRFHAVAPGAAGGAPGAPGEAGDEQDAPDWHTDAGGQNPAARGADGDGAGVRAGISGLLVRIPAGAQLRDAGVHPPLGTLPEGAMDSEAQDDQGPIQPSAERNRPKVAKASAQEPARAARGAESQAARALRLLWNHRELPGAGTVLVRSVPAVAQVARSAQQGRAPVMGTILAPSQDLSPPSCVRRAQYVPLSSETIVRGAGC